MVGGFAVYQIQISRWFCIWLFVAGHRGFPFLVDSVTSIIMSRTFVPFRTAGVKIQASDFMHRLSRQALLAAIAREPAGGSG